MSVETITLGCRLNFAESETIARSAPPNEDWIVVNSCAVTNEAVRQTRQAIRRAHRARPCAKILVTGCAAELDPASFAAMPEVSRVTGNANKLNSLAANDVMAPAGSRGMCEASLRCRRAATIAAPSARSGRREDPAVRFPSN